MLTYCGVKRRGHITGLCSGIVVAALRGYTRGTVRDTSAELMQLWARHLLTGPIITAGRQTPGAAYKCYAKTQ